jgi:hypothetical protein
LPVFMEPVFALSVQVLDPLSKYAGVTGPTEQSDFIALPGTILRVGAEAIQLQYCIGNDCVFIVILYISSCSKDLRIWSCGYSDFVIIDYNGQKSMFW